jgi:CRISPR type III-B/RAMP module-associated protein Cmr3
MSKTALVTFTPLEAYFFGGESTHGNGQAENYFAKGNPLPQQTTLLGTLRNVLRLQKRKYDFGKHSFSPDTQQSFGDLLGISAMFLKHEKDSKERFFLRQAIDRHEGGDPFGLLPETSGIEFFLDSGKTEASGQVKPAPRWQDYNPKEDLADCWVSAERETVRPDEIFKTHTRPGIPKKHLHNPKPDDPGMYKQQLYRLTPGWSFAVVATFSDAVDLTEPLIETLPMGGEKVVFHIKVEDEPRGFNGLFSQQEKMFYPSGKPIGHPRLVLLSDAFLETNSWANVLEAVTETTDFRHINTPGSLTLDKQFGRLQPPRHGQQMPNDQLAKSTKFTLLRRGSVLVCDEGNLENLQKALAGSPWATAGFNQFFTYA